MNPPPSPDADALRDAVFSVVRAIAPEVDPQRIEPDKVLRSQIDLDSMDWLNVVMGIGEKLQLQIPEEDYGKLATLNSIVAYLAGRLGHPGAA